MKYRIITFALALSFIPLLAFAADPVAVDTCANLKGPFKSIAQIFNWASCTLIKTIVPFLFTLATAAFIWGIIQYFINPDNEEKRKKGKSYMIWGIIALFVMISMWGLVGVLSNTFGVKTFIPQLSQ
jgi:hypothetical protein